MSNDVKYIKEKKNRKIGPQYIVFDVDEHEAGQSLLVVRKRTGKFSPLEGDVELIENQAYEAEVARIAAAQRAVIMQKQEAMLAAAAAPTLRSERVSLDQITESADLKDGFVYAEELEDDEDDIYKKDSIDQALIKEKHRTFLEIAGDVDGALKTYGFDSKVGLPLLSAMQFSRIACVDISDEKIQVFFEAISNRRYYITRTNNTSINFDMTFHNALADAKSHPDRPVFIYIKGMKADDVMTYLKPIYDYIDNPDGDSYISASGKTYYISKNIYILFSLLEGEELSNVSRRLLRYISVLDMKMIPTVRGEKLSPCFLSLSQMRTSLTDHNSAQFREDSWKKIDQLVTSIGEINGYILQNKIINRIENAATVLLSSDLEEDEVVDSIVARNLMTEAIITKDKRALDNGNLFQVLDSYFGADKMTLTREVIRHYLSIKSAKTERSDN